MYYILNVSSPTLNTVHVKNAYMKTQALPIGFDPCHEVSLLQYGLVGFGSRTLTLTLNPFMKIMY